MSAAPARRLLFLSFALTLALAAPAGAQAPAAAPLPELLRGRGLLRLLQLREYATWLYSPAIKVPADARS